MKRVKTLNTAHKRLITGHLKFLQSRLYKITEHDKNYGKFKDFQEVLDTIITYSNDFKAFLILLKIFIKYPVRTFKHFSKSSLKRFIHEIMIYSSSKNLKFKKELVRFFGQLLK